MDFDRGQITITEGTDVYGSDGDKVGSVVAVQPNYVVVEKGFFFPTDYYIPMSAIASADDDGKVYLNVTKDVALNQGWESEPTAVTDYATVGSYATDVDTMAGGVAYDRDDVVADAGMIPGRDVAGLEHQSSGDLTHATVGDTVRVPVHEEELTATKSAREIGQVQIQKDVIEEERTLDVPVTEERVRVSRVDVDRPLTAAEGGAFEEGTINVPIRGEEVQVQKQVRVTGEVEIAKEQVQRTERVGDTVRREEVRVTEDMVGGPIGETERGL